MKNQITIETETRSGSCAPAPGSALRGRGLKIHNCYAAAVPDYPNTPKSVFAAIAYSLALRLSGNEVHADALATLRAEWVALHHAKIVPQRPPNSWLTCPEPKFTPCAAKA